MSPLPLLRPHARREASRLGLALGALLACAAALGASRPRTADGITVCGANDPAMLEQGSRHFATHPAHGGALSAQAVTATFTATNFIFNADGNSATPVDTVRIQVGESVQFTWVTGTHTTTNGDPADPDAGLLWDLPLDTTHRSQVVAFPTAGTFPFFCSNHVINNMKGVIVVTPPLGVGPRTQPGAGFVAPPAPNPTTGDLAVRFALTQPGHARLTAFDAGGRAVGTLFDRDVPAGTYSASWTGRSGAGGRVPPGTYFLRLTAPGVNDSRAITIVR